MKKYSYVDTKTPQELADLIEEKNIVITALVLQINANKKQIKKLKKGQ